MRFLDLWKATVPLAMAGCGLDSIAISQASKFQCSDLAVTAEFRGADAVILTFGESRLKLPQVRAASGARYADDAGNEFWTKDGALLTLAGQPQRQCTKL